MNIQILKKLNDNLPDSIKLFMTPIIRKKLIHNKVFQSQLRELELLDKKTKQEIKEDQIISLKEILLYAYENTIYYRNLFDEVHIQMNLLIEMSEDEFFKEFHKIPLLKVENIRDDINKLQVSNRKNFYKATTGGSTGRPLTVLLDKDSIYREKAFIYHFWSKAGYDYRTSKIVTFRGLEFNGKYKKVNPLYNEIILNPFLLNENTFYTYLKFMKSFRSEFIHGYPSAIFSFCKIARKKSENVTGLFKAAFFISENVYAFEQRYIEETLGCETYVFYGHSERAVFAENLDVGYTFNPLYGYTEFGENQEIICTGFLNKKMPLIRYKLDDYARNLGDYYEIEGHREKEVLFGKNGERISVAMINFHDDIMENVMGYQFIQNEKGEAKLNIVVNGTELEDIRGKIEKEVSNKIDKSLEINVQIVSELLLSKRGKYKMIIRNVKDDNNI